MRRKEYFEFKQFTVHQEHAAMKVGTDGALLGSLAATGKRILDIGTGTGLLSLMMAQRCPDAQITAIDVDENAIIDAQRNFSESPFGDRITLKQAPFQVFAKEEEGKYDCIICNPPYFDESLESKDESRTPVTRQVCLSAISSVVPTSSLRMKVFSLYVFRQRF